MTSTGASVVWLLRHGEREDFHDLDWGRTAERPHDPGLSRAGIEQARAAGVRLADEGIRRIFTSPYLRCAQTAHLVAERVRVPVHIERGIGELHHPDWTAGVPALLSTDALAELTGAFDASHEVVHAPGYPETIEEAFARSATTARAIIDRYDGTLLFVGHAVPVLGIVRDLSGDPGDFPCPPASLFRLERAPGRWKLSLCGDTAHL
jgi:broad specificity phosphatase PhoE